MVKPRHGGSGLAPGWRAWTWDTFCGQPSVGRVPHVTTVTSQTYWGMPALVLLMDTNVTAGLPRGTDMA
jgi:hypothetical protein